MASKQDRFYFENFIAAADCSCRAADFLVDCLEHYDARQLQRMMQDLHAIEHEGDGKKHEMSAALARAFVTPVDREDLALISANIDDVTDSLEEILEGLYMDQIQTILPGTVDFARRLADCCRLMKAMLSEFPNFKKPAQLHKLIIDLNHAEEECDRIYMEATMNIRKHCTDVLDIVSWREIYARMENCADACEHVGDCVDMVVMKNT
ncbi:MAG: DUF47 domain-containing protein [Candidatus Spyradocola sp.]